MVFDSFTNLRDDIVKDYNDKILKKTISDGDIEKYTSLVSAIEKYDKIIKVYNLNRPKEKQIPQLGITLKNFKKINSSVVNYFPY